MSRQVVLAAALIVSACGSVESAAPTTDYEQNEAGLELDRRPDGRGAETHNQQKTGAARPSGSGIYYHGGPVMLGTTHVYYIWYGNWSGNTATEILSDLASSIGGSPYFNINTSYSDLFARKVSNAVTLAGITTDSYSQGASLSDAGVRAVVNAALTSGRLPADANGVYFVLSSADVNETSGFCSKYCGWHTYATLAGVNIKYAFVGNADRCPSACAAQSTASPNNNPGADAMASVLVHELEEAVTDPNLNAWFDRSGQENADKCAWTFGTTNLLPNGSKANVTLGSRSYLIQRNWVNVGSGYCGLAYP